MAAECLEDGAKKLFSGHFIQSHLFFGKGAKIVQSGISNWPSHCLGTRLSLWKASARKTLQNQMSREVPLVWQSSPVVSTGKWAAEYCIFFCVDYKWQLLPIQERNNFQRYPLYMCKLINPVHTGFVYTMYHIIKLRADVCFCLTVISTETIYSV